MERLLETENLNEFVQFLNEDLLFPYFRKGVPSVFNEMKRLYTSADKYKIIENVLLAH